MEGRGTHRERSTITPLLRVTFFSSSERLLSLTGGARPGEKVLGGVSLISTQTQDPHLPKAITIPRGGKLKDSQLLCWMQAPSVDDEEMQK